MGLVAFLSFISFSSFFGLLAVFFSLKEEKIKHEMKKKEKELSRKLFEVSFLNEISEKIGYSLSIDSVAQTIVTSIENLFRLSTVSYAVCSDNTINIKTFIKEPVGNGFIQSVKNIIISSLNGIDEKTKSFTVIDSSEKDSISSTALPFDTVPQSYFNIPLVVNNRVRGLINISSIQRNLFQEEDMSFLYKIVNQAVQAIGKLEAVIETEKGKTDSLIASLSSGAMLFLFHEKDVILSTINEAARKYLRLEEGVLDTKKIIASFGQSQSIQDRVGEVITHKKTAILNDVELFGKHFKIYISPVFYYDTREVIGASVTMQDVTLEKELEQLRENFTNMVVHELRAPLSAIKGASGLLQSGKLKQEDISKMLSVIYDSSQQGLSEISDLLDAAKLDAGRFTVKKELGDINELVAARAETFSYLGKEKGVVITYHTQAGIPRFLFDKERIGQVINNLFSNSIKYTHAGGRITVETMLNGAFLEVLVEDTGIGIPEEKIELLFSRYGQIGSAFKKDSTGLGLFISKGIVESHGGKIWLESKVGHGTKAYFTIPVVLQDEAFIPHDEKPSISQVKMVN